MNMSENQITVRSRRKTIFLVETAMLAAVILLMSFTPLGYLKTAGVEITFIMIPVVIGAITLGPTAGAILGAVWGFTSFGQCFGLFGLSQFGAVLFGINPIYTFIICIPTRILAGWLSGVIFKAVMSASKGKSVLASVIAALSVALINTLLFVGGLLLLFGSTEYIRGLMGEMNILVFAVAFVGLNGLIEAITTCVVGSAISIALTKALRKVA